LTETVNFLIASASPYDEVILKITSPGGAVHLYGLAAAQINRLRAAGIHVTVAVDLVAASGQSP
jgi:serine protease SohB